MTMFTGCPSGGCPGSPQRGNTATRWARVERASPPARVTQRTQRTQRKSRRSLRVRVCGHHQGRTSPLSSFRATSWETRNQVLSAGAMLPYDAAIEAIHTAPTRCRLKAGMTYWMGAVDSLAISSRFRSPVNVSASKNFRKPRGNWI